jgi:nicotinamide riboside transporter PnuC
MSIWPRAHLPMQSVLQAYYVVMSFYGWYSWTRAQRQEEGRITRWPPYYHLVALAAIVLLSSHLGALACD